MKGLILAAGLGSRLKPWTDSHPKALVPVGGVPMLERLVSKMLSSGITDITVNVYHFADQIIDFINHKGWEIKISDERPNLLETGGAILHAAQLLEGDEPILVHNADILSNLSFDDIMNFHLNNGADASLVVSKRDSSRKLIFDREGNLKGWHSIKDNSYKPFAFIPADDDLELAFSGIYVISPSLISKMKIGGWSGKFSIMDYFLSSLNENRYKAFPGDNLQIIDIGKPDSLNRANIVFKS